MAEMITIARPYAEAAFKVARDARTLPAWSEALARLAAVASTDVAHRLIGHPGVPAATIAAAVADTAGSLDAAQANFVRLLADNERLGVLGDIASLFEALRNEHEGVLEASISSAFPIDAAKVDSIVATLTQRYGRRIKASVSVDPELIGGVSIRIGDEVIDASVRGKLAQMASALTA
ncbi:MAG: F0F1 ATP synthase subunit delta [Betaproteobacteria bacterium]